MFNLFEVNNIKPVARLRQQILDRHLEVEKCPGIYRWWFPKNNAENLLAHFKNKMSLDGRKLQERNIDGVPYIALYFGISSNMRRRIRWHICGPFKSSTLRRTLRAIIAPKEDDKAAEKMVNQMIDSCFWEWDYTESAELAEEHETKELAQEKYTYPLNISKNNTVTSEWIKELRCTREKAIKSNFEKPLIAGK